jgi:preprotein translocase subunit YajC
MDPTQIYLATCIIVFVIISILFFLISRKKQEGQV